MADVLPCHLAPTSCHRLVHHPHVDDRFVAELHRGAGAHEFSVRRGGLGRRGEQFRFDDGALLLLSGRSGEPIRLWSDDRLGSIRRCAVLLDH
ncbi:hypothetical protein BGU32_18335 [Clostridioides difficile]|nr:hypothetical protein BGU32_18335 [Clostridioides difficile]